MQVALTSKAALGCTLARKPALAGRSRQAVAVRAVAAETATKLNTKRSEEVGGPANWPRSAPAETQKAKQADA